jgi:hypothetical protein
MKDAIGPSPRRPPRLAVEHQGKEAERLGLVGRELHRQPRKPDRLIGEACQPRVGTGDVVPGGTIGRVDRGQYRRQPLGNIFRLGYRKRDAGVADASLGAHQPLAHRSGRDQEA